MGQRDVDAGAVVAKSDGDGDAVVEAHLARLRAVLAGERRCLASWELERLAEIQNRPPEQLNEAEQLLVSLFEQHVTAEGCPDCSEWYEAERLIRSAAERAIDRSVTRN